MQIGVELAPEIGYNIIGQAFDTYILLQRGEDLIIIDQHAAHEHINYAKLVQQAETGGITVTLTADENTNSVTCANTRTVPYWLDGDSFRINVFTKPQAQS